MLIHFNIWERALFACAAVMLIVTSGCSTPEKHFPRIINEPAPLPAEVRARFGRMGMLPVGAATNVFFYPPPNRAEVFNRVAGRTFDSTYDHVQSRGPDGFASKVMASTIGAVTGGALASLIKGVPPEEFEASQAALRKALNEESLPAEIQHELEAAITNAHLPALTIVSESAVASARAESGRLNDLPALRSQGLETVLEIHVTEVSFELNTGFNPDIAFSPQIIVQVRSVTGGSVLYSRYFEYRGEQRKFTTWAGDDARAFRDEVGFAAREFARVILEHFASEPADGPR